MLQRCHAGRARRLSVPILIAALGFGAVSTRSQAQNAGADALLAIDLNRSTVIDRIVMQWGGLVLPSGSVLDTGQLRARLSSLRADRLLAASLAGTSHGLQQVLAQAEATTRREARLKSLGDAAVDLTYTPLTPCRIIDSRNAVGPLQPGVIRTEVGYTTTTFAAQGGASTNCGIPAGVAALALNVVAVNPANLGFIKLWPANAAQPNASTINYDPTTTNIATGTIVRVTGANNSFNAVSPAQVQMVVDVVGYFKSVADATAMNFNVNGQRVMRFEDTSEAPNIIGGDANNSAGPFVGQTIAGGGGPSSGCYDPVSNTTARSCGNQTASDLATIGGGAANIASGGASTVAGGGSNTASSQGATVSGGAFNLATGFYATVPGGSFNQAAGAWSLAAGSHAVVSHDNSFLWCDGHTTCNSQAARDFIVVASGGIKLYTADGLGGCLLTNPAGNGWVCSSDRNLKENFAELDAVDVLRRVAAMPVKRWNVKGVPAIDHIGPVAQDFHAAFGLGADDLHIASGDASGVALAAIQGLHQLVQEKDAKIAAQQREIDAQRAELAIVNERLSQLDLLLRDGLNALKRAATNGDAQVAMRGAP